MLELIGSVTTLAVLLAVAAPNVSRVSDAFKLDDVSRTVAMALAQARVAAITRGHPIDVSFTPQSFTMTDPEIGADGYVLINGELTAPTTLTASGTTSFTPLGTVTAPLTVTIRGAGRQRVVRLGLGGEVELE